MDTPTHMPIKIDAHTNRQRCIYVCMWIISLAYINVSIWICVCCQVEKLWVSAFFRPLYARGDAQWRVGTQHVLLAPMLLTFVYGHLHGHTQQQHMYVCMYICMAVCVYIGMYFVAFLTICLINFSHIVRFQRWTAAFCFLHTYIHTNGNTQR